MATGVHVHPVVSRHTLGGPPVAAGLLLHSSVLPAGKQFSAQADERVYGLEHSHLDAYAEVPHTSAHTAPPVRMLRAAEFAQMYADYAALDVPHDAVFPYLYCGSFGSTTQNMYFHGSVLAPSAPRYRGLTIVRATPLSSLPKHSLLISSVLPHEILHTPRFGNWRSARFLSKKQSLQVSMRDFATQCVNYAMVSDMVVYAPHGATREARVTAMALRNAQQEYWIERQAQSRGGLQYNVFVIDDSFEELERVCPHLVAVRSDGRPLHQIDFLQHESDEIQNLSAASPISTNVWLGTNRDLTIRREQFHITVEALEDSEELSHAFLDMVTHSFTRHDVAVAQKRSTSVPKAHIECPTGAQLHTKPVQELACSVLELCAWLHMQAHPIACAPPQRARPVLLHCPDGYTETSVPALAYLMYERGLSLAAAYYELQVTFNRSFFVYPHDLKLLKAIQRLIPQAREQCPPATPADAVSPCDDDSWMDDSHFDGSFPSRILPFLYLGNLNHALNARMLRLLGITHVVSVGESGLRASGASDMHSLRAAYEAGAIDVLDLANVMDDGIDSLRPVMCRAINFIEHARLNGGRVLVHCRVGVSRSSTLVLAYVMAHLDMSLVDSYLYVRSRRLSVLIQPHLLFFWELRGWEAWLAKCKRSPGYQGDVLSIDIGAGARMYGTNHTRRYALGDYVLTWSSLCRKIATLNERYMVS